MRRNLFIRHTMTLIGVVTASLVASPARGQFHIVSRERLDSLANPALANGAQAMRFAAKRIDTGRIGEDDGPKSYRFEWQNTGDKPLVITRVTTTCGCAVPAWDRQPVKPGDKASVTVTYHPKGHPGSFTRKIFLFTQLSASAPSATLELTGEVIPSARPTYAYPYARGNLLLKQEAIPFDPSQEGVERIECLNGGNDTLRLKIDTRILPPGIRAEFSPEILPPGGLTDLIVRFDPAAGKVPRKVPIFIRGVGLPPSQSAVTLRFDSDINDSINCE